MQTMLRLAGFGDNAGSGFPSIIAACAAEDWYVLELEENTILNQVTLTLRFKEVYGRTNRKTTQNTTQSGENTTQSTTQSSTAGKQLKDKYKMILEVIEQMPEASQSVIAEKLHWDVNTVKYYTNKLKKNGYLKRKGNSRKGEWIIER